MAVLNGGKLPWTGAKSDADIIRMKQTVDMHEFAGDLQAEEVRDEKETDYDPSLTHVVLSDSYSPFWTKCKEMGSTMIALHRICSVCQTRYFRGGGSVRLCTF